jgi:hypothetical protein
MDYEEFAHLVDDKQFDVLHGDKFDDFLEIRDLNLGSLDEDRQVLAEASAYSESDNRL